MSDKETAPWIKFLKECVKYQSFKFVPDHKKAEELILAAECTAPAPQPDCPQVTPSPWKVGYVKSGTSRTPYSYIDAGNGKQFWANEAEEIVKLHNEVTSGGRFSQKRGNLSPSTSLKLPIHGSPTQARGGVIARSINSTATGVIIR